jgi:hypothetical protein
MNYLAIKQALASVLFIVLGTLFLPHMNLGFTVGMLGLFRVLCVGYALYAIATASC